MAEEIRAEMEAELVDKAAVLQVYPNATRECSQTMLRAIVEGRVTWLTLRQVVAAADWVDIHGGPDAFTSQEEITSRQETARDLRAHVMFLAALLEGAGIPREDENG
jgi:hypothetical protein